MVFVFGSGSLDGRARRDPIAVAIKQHADEEAGWASFSAIVVLGGVAGEPGLDSIPERGIDNRFRFAQKGLFVVNDLAAINAVLQHQVERTTGEWLPARDAARGAGPQPALDAPGLPARPSHTAQRRVRHSVDK